MPWITPTLRKVRETVRDDITAALYGAAFVGNNVMRVMSDAMAATMHGVLRYVDWVRLQPLPDTAELEFLDRHGQIWLVNSDGSIGRKQATFAQGVVTMTGAVGAVVPAATQLVGNGIGYETMTEIVIGADAATDVRVRALDAGKAGNAPETLICVSTPVNVDSSAEVVELTGGADVETDDDLRTRVLLRIRKPPMGGDQIDYVQWALAVPGVTRAWNRPLEMGIGTTTVRFMMDDLRGDIQGFPTGIDIDAVRAYMDTVRPVAVKDLFIVAPLPRRIDVTIQGLVPDTPSIRAAVEANLKDMLRRKAAPGETIYVAWKYQAIMDTAGVVSFDLLNAIDDVMPSPGHMPVLGDIVFIGVPAIVPPPVHIVT